VKITSPNHEKIYLAYFFILFSIFLVVGSIIYFNRTYDKISNNLKLFENKYDFLESSNSLINQIRDLESYQRGYLLTNNPKLKEDYNKSKYQLNLQKDRFYNLTYRYGLEQTNPREIENLKNLVEEKISFMDSTLFLEDRGLRQEAINLINTNIGLIVMEDINNIIQKLNTENKYKETIAKQFIYKSRSSLRTTNIIVFSFLMVTLIFLGFYIKNFMAKSQD
jgi:CHASE3 domain sensor protein